MTVCEKLILSNIVQIFLYYRFHQPKLPSLCFFNNFWRVRRPWILTQTTLLCLKNLLYFFCYVGTVYPIKEFWDGEKLPVPTSPNNYLANQWRTSRRSNRVVVQWWRTKDLNRQNKSILKGEKIQKRWRIVLYGEDFVFASEKIPKIQRKNHIKLTCQGAEHLRQIRD